MSTTFSTASVAAPSPATAKDRLPGPPSKEDLATAALLQNFNQSNERFHMVNQQNTRRHDERPAERDIDANAEVSQGTRPLDVSEYHSLDDAVSYQNTERTPPASSDHGFNTSPRMPSNSAPSTGQVCRYVVVFLLPMVFDSVFRSATSYLVIG